MSIQTEMLRREIVSHSESWQRLIKMLLEWELTRLLNEVAEEGNTLREGRPN